nr:hypothetical protein [Arenivirga flava]
MPDFDLRPPQDPMAERLGGWVDKLLSVHRPAVLAHLRSIRRAKPDASPAEIARILERRYLAAVTTGGAAVGASAAVPGLGTGAALALTGVETAGFLEASALYAQSITELHGIALEDPTRARALVMTMIMGGPGVELVKHLTAQATGSGVGMSGYWGSTLAQRLPRTAFGPIGDQLRNAFLRRFAANTGAGAIGRLVPFGIGAAIGGSGNLILGRRVIAASRTAFGPPADVFPDALAIETKERKQRDLAPRRALLPGRRKRERS